jgi:hypothetical protein
LSQASDVCSWPNENGDFGPVFVFGRAKEGQRRFGGSRSTAKYSVNRVDSGLVINHNHDSDQSHCVV